MKLASLLFLLLTLLMPADLSAQSGQQRARALDLLREGYRVRLSTVDGTFEGTLAGSSAIEVRLSISDSLRTFPAGSIEGLWVRRTHARRGAILGGVIGGVVLGGMTGLLATALCGSDCEGAGDFAAGFVLGGAVGAAGGSVVGVVAGSWILTWQREFP
ncbi:MAG TPA: hypothetical protein VMM79_00030 [Longimicrobiales bacterium]|nr:hypothetical protein [Longimicrobiales bacterium]